MSEVCEHNVRHTIEVIREKSPIIKAMEDEGKIKVIGAIYDLSTGKVRFLDS